MITEIIMPKNGMDMLEGVLVRWLKNEGDVVEYEEPIFVVETDKITMESEAPAKGILLKKLYEEGTTVPVFTVLGYIGEPGDVIPETTQEAVEEKIENTESVADNAPIKAESTEKKATSNDGVVLATPYAKTLANEYNIEISTVKPSGKWGEVKAADVQSVVKNTTPLARAIAAGGNIDVSMTSGSGFAGKVVKEDVIRKDVSEKVVVAESEADTVENIPMSSMRKVIAKRMTSSCNNVPTVTQNVRVDVTELLALREKLNENREKTERITLNDFIVKAVGESLKTFERFRMTYNEDHFELHSAIDIGVAVSIDGGLVVPVVRNVDKLSLGQVSKEVKRLAKNAKNNCLQPAEMGNARISITNLGMYGLYSFNPIINEPEAAIVGVCSTEDVPAIENGALVSRKKFMLCVTYDHRVLNGAEVCEFENNVKKLLENPYSLIL